MKNTLAENMLRFGTKNLSKSNRKNIIENTIDGLPGFTHPLTGNNYKLPFKDLNQLIKFTTPPPLGAMFEKPNTDRVSTLDTDFYYYAGAILQKVALAGVYHPNDYSTPQKFYDYLYNRNLEYPMNEDNYEKIECKSAGHGNAKWIKVVRDILYDDIETSNADIKANQTKGVAIPGQDLASSKFLQAWSSMMKTLNSIIPQRISAI
jgi:sarcosine oxidase delta subunit